MYGGVACGSRGVPINNEILSVDTMRWRNVYKAAGSITNATGSHRPMCWRPLVVANGGELLVSTGGQNHVVLNWPLTDMSAMG